MRIVLFWCALLGSTALLGFAQGTPADHRGAKAIFFDPNSNVSVDTAPAAQAKTGTDRKVTPGSHPRAAVAAMNPGLMYYLELVKPSGEVLRVTSNQVFHSGERVRIHFVSNVAGRLTIVQPQADGSSRVLFPDSRVRNGENTIEANEDMVVPGEKGWFRFDSHPGEERLMVFLDPRPDGSHGESMRAGDRLSSTKTLQLASDIRQQRGSKSIMLEVDDSSEKPATYVVKPASATMKPTSSQMLATEIIFNHRP